MGIFWEKKNKEDGKKSRFLLEIPNEGGRFSIEFVRYFLNAVLLNLSGQNLMQIYGQKLLLGSFVRKFLAVMMRIYGQKPLSGAFVRKTGSETSEFLRTNGHF